MIYYLCFQPYTKKGEGQGNKNNLLCTSCTGANLKGAQFDNSQMNGAILRLASLKGASLKSCNLRYSVMAGTDLEVASGTPGAGPHMQLYMQIG